MFENLTLKDLLKLFSAPQLVALIGDNGLKDLKDMSKRPELTLEDVLEVRDSLEAALNKMERLRSDLTFERHLETGKIKIYGTNSQE
jgi:hypothetical protein